MRPLVAALSLALSIILSCLYCDKAAACSPALPDGSCTCGTLDESLARTLSEETGNAVSLAEVVEVKANGQLRVRLTKHELDSELPVGTTVLVQPAHSTCSQLKKTFAIGDEVVVVYVAEHRHAAQNCAPYRECVSKSCEAASAGEDDAGVSGDAAVVDVDDACRVACEDDTRLECEVLAATKPEIGSVLVGSWDGTTARFDVDAEYSRKDLAALVSADDCSRQLFNRENAKRIDAGEPTPSGGGCRGSVDESDGCAVIVPGSTRASGSAYGLAAIACAALVLVRRRQRRGS